MGKNLFNTNEKAPHRVVLKNNGYAEEKLESPLIGILHSVSDTSNRPSVYYDMINRIKNGIISADGIPLALPVCSANNTLSLGENGNRYIMPLRDLIVASVETAAYANSLDAIVLFATDDISLAGMLMGAARCNIPCIVFSGGTSAVTKYDGENIDVTSAFYGTGETLAGKISALELKRIEYAAAQNAGGSCVLDSTNTMACLCEAMGISLVGDSTAQSTSAEKLRLAFECGSKIVQVFNDQLTPRKVISVDALKNACAVLNAVGGNADCVLHLLALACELDVKFNMSVVDTIFSEVPLLVNFKPFGNAYMQDFHSAGGVYALMRELQDAKSFSTKPLTVVNSNIGILINAKDTFIKQKGSANIINTLQNPSHKRGAFCVLFGNIADNGCILRVQPHDHTPASFVAKVYNTEDDALRAVKSRNIKIGDCIVVRNEGPKGSPGMRDVTLLLSLLKGMGLAKDVAVITDGRIGAFGQGYCVGQICPEAAEGGTIALIEDGDKIDIDLNKNKLNLNVTAKELTVRRKKWKPLDVNASGHLLQYHLSAMPASSGAAIKK